MFNHIEQLYKDYNIDISHAEQMSEFYIKKFNTPFESFIDLDIHYNKV